MEIAVGAARLAERDLDVDAVFHGSDKVSTVACRDASAASGEHLIR
jgi:hypothetical protein